MLTGEAAVTLGATNQGMVAGDLVNTAARLQSVAPPGTVLVGEATQRAASSAIAFEPAGDQLLKGKVAPVAAFRALRVVAERGGRGRSDTLEAPFVGRDDELRLLKDLYHATVREGRTRLVSVTGIGGIGKSRLTWEFEKYLDGIVGTIWWHRGRSPSYGEGITFWALSEMIRGRAGLAETDDERTTRAGIARMLDGLTFDDAERRWIEPALLALLGIETGIGSEQLFGAWRTFFERLAATGPVVLVFEDLHWADAGTLDFVDHLLEWSRATTLYIVTLARPELLDRRPDWGAGKRNFTSLYLEPLSEQAMRALLAGVVPGLPETAVRAIVDRADGIPLYAVETVRMLVAEGRLGASGDGTYAPTGDLTTLAVPETLTALIAARLDGLDPADRSLVLDAAVLGQSFTRAALAVVSGIDELSLEPRLRALVRRELFAHLTDPRSPERGQYAFVQALIREVAYNTLARRDRKARHLAAARHFESIGSDELAPALAGHYLAASENAADGPEADTLAAQARVALRAAAEHAAALGSHDQAVGFLTQAIAVTTDSAERAALMERAGVSASIGASHDLAERLLQEAMDGYVALDDPDGLARAAAALASEQVNRYRVEAAIETVTSAMERLSGVEDRPAVVGLRAMLARAYYMHDEPRRAIEIADGVLEAAERLDDGSIVAEVLIARGGALGDLGRTHEGLAVIEGGLRLAQRRNLSLLALRARNSLAVYLMQREPVRASAVLREGIAEARRIGARQMLLRLLTNGVEHARLCGDWQWALDELETARSLDFDPTDRAYFIGQEAILRAWRGDAVDELMAEVEAIGRDEPDPNFQALVLGVRSDVAFGDGSLEAAHRWYREAAAVSPVNAPLSLGYAARAAIWLRDAAAAGDDLASLDATGAHGSALTARRTAIMAGIVGLRGDRAAAIATFRQAADAWRALEMPVEIAFLAIDMATTLGPDVPEVLEAAEESRGILEGLGARPFLARLDVLLGAGAERIGSAEPA